MVMPLLAVIGGFALLVWSANRFVDGASATAVHAGMPLLLVGILVVGFGTSAPEMVVSAVAASEGKPELAIGNALGSNIVNIGLILGLAALIAPILVQSNIVRKELPLLLVISAALGVMLLDSSISRFEAMLLLAGFVALVGWSVYSGLKSRKDTLEQDVDQELDQQPMPLKNALLWLVAGMLLLVLSSRILVWGAVEIAQQLGVSDLLIGLTIVAIGTSLPELASSIAAARKGEHDLAIGNIVGSNMFNILAVIGIAATIDPIESISALVLARDWVVMMVLTVALLIMAYGFGRQGRVNRFEGTALLVGYAAYTAYLVSTSI